LNPRERGVALKVAGALIATRMGLRRAGFRRWKGLLAKLIPDEPLAPTQAHPALADRAQSIILMEAAAARHLLFRPTCLERSLVLWWMLRREGVAAELRVGATKDAGRFEAHAWVEYCGAVLNDPEGEHRGFVPFDGPIDSMETQTH